MGHRPQPSTTATVAAVAGTCGRGAPPGRHRGSHSIAPFSPVKVLCRSWLLLAGTKALVLATALGRSFAPGLGFLAGVFQSILAGITHENNPPFRSIDDIRSFHLAAIGSTPDALTAVSPVIGWSSPANLICIPHSWKCGSRTERDVSAPGSTTRRPFGHPSLAVTIRCSSIRGRPGRRPTWTDRPQMTVGGIVGTATVIVAGDRSLPRSESILGPSTRAGPSTINGCHSPAGLGRLEARGEERGQGNRAPGMHDLTERLLSIQRSVPGHRRRPMTNRDTQSYRTGEH